jgi:subtilisin family serine protease
MATSILARSARITWKATRILSRIIFWFLAIFGLVTLCALIAIAYGMPSIPVDPQKVKLIRYAASEGKLAYRLTVPEEIEGMLGTPLTRTTVNDDSSIQRRILVWPGVQAVFAKERDYSAPFTLSYMKIGGIGGKSIRIDILTDFLNRMPVDIGSNRPIVLRNENDLTKFNTFWGYAGVSLVNLDLKSHAELLDKMPFDSRTKWPNSDKLPDGFDPVSLLEKGKNPGLGVRRLHEQGVNGLGVSIAIIDGSLLQNHREYAQQMVTYKEVGLAKLMSPQMHGTAVAGIAVGKTCGVAPKASLYYFAVDGLKSDNQPYCDVIHKIIKLNKNRGVSEQIRVVNISDGRFSRWANFDHWQQTLTEAEQNGLLVVTCDHSEFLIYGTLARITGKDPDNPLSYRRGKYSCAVDVLRVPAGNRTIASHHGPEEYTFVRNGGMSWAAPYLAGLAALAYQVNPEIKPKTIIELWLQTATATDAGPIINPVGFVEAVRKLG